MTRAQEYTTRLTSLAELGAIYGIEAGEAPEEAPADPPVQETAASPATPAGRDAAGEAGTIAPAPDLTAMLAELDAASGTLAAIARQDQAARETALQELARYDALVAVRQEAEAAHERAQLCWLLCPSVCA